MKDIPLFTGEYGTASLALREIPYRREAYIHLRTVQPRHLVKLIEECIAFCRMAGAERIYATGEGMEIYPLHAIVLEMRGVAAVNAEPAAHLFPVTERTAAEWRKIWNHRMENVDCAATLTVWEETQLLTGGAYFVHRAGELLGLGWLMNGKLKALCTVKPGVGTEVMQTLLQTVPEQSLTLEVASTNVRAIRLYERFGFVKTAEITRWHQVF